MNQDEIKQYLKENLRLESYPSPNYDSQNNIVIELFLEDEVISYIEVDTTNKD